MFQRFNHRLVGIRQFNVLTDHTDGDFACRISFFIDYLFPFGRLLPDKLLNRLQI